MKVSVIVPCYNQSHYLEEALQSVSAQTYQDWECLIINDGSTDDTEPIGQLWARKDPRFTCYTKPNGGLSNARNFGIEKAEGIYILPLDADDKISSNYIELCVKALEIHHAKLVYGRVEQFGVRTGIWDLGSYSFNGLLNSNMIHCAAMYRKEDWKRVGGYDETLREGLEDWELWVHILEAQDLVQFLDTITFYYRIKEESMITLMGKEKERQVKAYVFEKHASKYFSLFKDLYKENTDFKQNLKDKTFVLKRFLKLLFK